MTGKDSYSSCAAVLQLSREKAAGVGHGAVGTGAWCGESHYCSLVSTAGSH